MSGASRHHYKLKNHCNLGTIRSLSVLSPKAFHLPLTNFSRPDCADCPTGDEVNETKFLCETSLFPRLR